MFVNWIFFFVGGWGGLFNLHAPLLPQWGLRTTAGHPVSFHVILHIRNHFELFVAYVCRQLSFTVNGIVIGSTPAQSHSIKHLHKLPKHRIYRSTHISSILGALFPLRSILHNSCTLENSFKWLIFSYNAALLYMTYIQTALVLAGLHFHSFWLGRWFDIDYQPQSSAVMYHIHVLRTWWGGSKREKHEKLLLHLYSKFQRVEITL